ncbi:FAD NAD(P)-binding domain-containing [Lecanosticta acicola]|uniref:FAD NAD(P)-binding domain-containing n=1 Tax=Lecanosticta acicola TaxID=111012 RepID=A0AAI8YSW9_9PEZI|nr:FAD NAD(P)-binding domain-containing [Lecanosticta acicola]
MSKQLRILISGSGIAGGASAFWLLRAFPQARITIVERAPSLRLTGASVDIRSSAVDVIKWMGLEREIREHTTHEEGMQFVKADGRPVATLRSTGRDDIQSLTSEYEIFRGELGRILIEPVLPHVNLIYDETVEDYEEKEDGVAVTFTKSKETKTYDLLVAADGFGSRLRGKMTGCSPREHVVDEGCRVAYWTMEGDLLKGERLAKMHTATGGRCAVIRPDPHPDRRTRAMFLNVLPLNDTERQDLFETALEKGNESYTKLMEETFHDAGWLAPELLEGMRKSDDLYCSWFAQIQCPKLHSDRVVLVGDAGYATPGIGTSLAIIGGYVLAGELLSHAGDIPLALRNYQELMLPFVKSQQGGVGAMQWMAPQTQWGINVRDRILSIALGLKMDRVVTYGSAMLGFTEKKLKMPEYAWPAQCSE